MFCLVIMLLLFGLNIFISFYNYTSIQIYMMIIQAMGLERKLKAYKVLLPIKFLLLFSVGVADSEKRAAFFSVYHVCIS